MPDRSKKVSGIYAITNVANGKAYYGSSVDVWRRQRQHWHGLRSNSHRNPHLQSAWNLYGEASFVFDLLEEVAASDLQAVEQKYLDKNNNGYNISKCAECAPRGIKWSMEARKRAGDARRGVRLSEEHKKALSVAGINRKWKMPEAQRMATSLRMKGRALGSSVKNKISQKIKTLWADKDFRKRLVVAQSIGRITEAAKHNYSCALLKRWRDPEQRKKLSMERKARWTNPDYRYKMLEKRKLQGAALRLKNQQKKEKQCMREMVES